MQGGILSASEGDLRRAEMRGRLAGQHEGLAAGREEVLGELRAGTGSDRWKSELATSTRGELLGDERNVVIALRRAPELAGLVRYNECAHAIELARAPPWRDADAGAAWAETDDTQLTVWLQGAGLKLRGVGPVADCVGLVARDLAFHPIRNYLRGLTWDGERRLQVWLAEYLHATGDPEYQAAVGARFLISAVARISRPGCQVDHVLTLEGPQGIGKTTAARILAVRPEWFAGELPDLASKDAMLQLVGRWIIELAELKAVKTSELERVKSFLTQTHDTFRPPYGRRTAQFPRQCVFIATTNEREYLRDRTGNRRYWPVRCGRIDADALLRDREQIWAEARHEFEQGTRWHLTAEESQLAIGQQKERVFVTELEHDVAAYLAREREAGRNETTVRDVLMHGVGLDPAARGYATEARKLGATVAEALEAAGWGKVGRKQTAGNRRTLYRFQS